MTIDVHSCSVFGMAQNAVLALQFVPGASESPPLPHRRAYE